MNEENKSCSPLLLLVGPTGGLISAFGAPGVLAVRVTAVTQQRQKSITFKGRNHSQPCQGDKITERQKHVTQMVQRVEWEPQSCFYSENYRMPGLEGPERLPSSKTPSSLALDLTTSPVLPSIPFIFLSPSISFPYLCTEFSLTFVSKRAQGVEGSTFQLQRKKGNAAVGTVKNPNSSQAQPMPL